MGRACQVAWRPHRAALIGVVAGAPCGVLRQVTTSPRQPHIHEGHHSILGRCSLWPGIPLIIVFAFFLVCFGCKIPKFCRLADLVPCLSSRHKLQVLVQNYRLAESCLQPPFRIPARPPRSARRSDNLFQALHPRHSQSRQHDSLVLGVGHVLLLLSRIHVAKSTQNPRKNPRRKIHAESTQESTQESTAPAVNFAWRRRACDTTVHGLDICALCAKARM